MATQFYNVKDNRPWWRKLKALLTSRTDTLRQSDAVTDMLMDRLQETQAELLRTRAAAAKFAQLVLVQNEALKLVHVAIVNGDWSEGNDQSYVVQAKTAVLDALEAAKEHV